MSHQLRFISVLLLALTLIFTACSKKSNELGNQAHLEYIPADTPYLVASLKPLPDDLRKKWSESYEGIFKILSRISNDSYNEYLERAKEYSDQDEDSDELENDVWDNKWVKALQEEFSDGFSLSELNKFGIDKKSLFSIYGNGVLPVFRLSLSDTDLFINTIERIEENAGSEIPELNIEGMRVWSISNKDKDDGELVFATSDSDLIVSFLPAGATSDMLEKLIGKQKPENNIASTKILNNLMESKSYLPEGIGFIDFEQILNRFIEEPTGLDKDLFALSDELSYQRSEFNEEITEQCKTDLRTIVKNVPRLLLGFTRLDNEAMDYESLFEVRSDLAKEMTKLTSPVPGLGQPAGLFSLGFSMNIPEMRDFAIRRIESMQNEPYKCDFLTPDEDSLDKMLAAVKNPAAGFVESVHGMNIVLDDVDVNAFMELIDQEEKSSEELDMQTIQDLLAEKFSAFAVLAADKPKTMINMGKMLSPELAALDIKANGKAILINDLFPEAPPFDVYSAMDDKALTFSVGKNSKSNSEKILSMKPSDKNPLFSYSVNVHKYLELFRELMINPDIAKSFAEENEDMTIEELESLLSALMGSGKVTFNIMLREDGVAIEQNVILED